MKSNNKTLQAQKLAFADFADFGLHDAPLVTGMFLNWNAEGFGGQVACLGQQVGKQSKQSFRSFPRSCQRKLGRQTH